MEWLDKNTIKLDKVENELDKFVLEFVKILEKHVRYVIVSGYVVILFGRTRATEDIDMIVEKMTKQQVRELYNALESHSYYCLNSDDAEDMYDHLKEKLALRFAKKKTIIPNFEIKWIKHHLDAETIAHPVTVILPSGSLFISPLEQQIAYKKAVLKSEKDMEDAAHLEKIFEGRLDNNLIQRYQRIFERI